MQWLSLQLTSLVQYGHNITGLRIHFFVLSFYSSEKHSTLQNKKLKYADFPQGKTVFLGICARELSTHIGTRK